MKTSIYYFTGTGNSLYAAKYISKEIRNSSVKPIVKSINEGTLTDDAETIGIVFPLYYGGLPEVVIKFLSEIKLRKDAYIFAVCTRGKTSGHAMSQIDNILKDKQFYLNASFYVTMPSNYLRIYDMKSQDKVMEIIKKSDKRLGEIVRTIRTKENNSIKSSVAKPLMKAVYKNYFIRKVHAMDKGFHVDESCTSCGVCMRVCPVDNIKIIDGHPIWGHNCQDCMACIQLCSSKSIQIGNKTIKRGRYKNPFIHIDEIMDQK